MRRLWLLLPALLISILGGCTRQAWFQGFVEGQVYQCNKLPGPERVDCLDSINRDYQRYQDERENHLQ